MKINRLLPLLGALLAILASGLAVPVSVPNAIDGKNPELTDRFVEGDILVRDTRNTVTSPYRKWPFCKIPFHISCQKYTPYVLQLLKRALEEIEQITGIRFDEIDDPGVPIGGFINITCEPGCYADIGYFRGPCIVNLEHVSECFKPGVTFHQIMHVLGFWHQDTSYNRDTFLNIQWDNIMDDKLSEFDKQTENESTNLCVQYDYSSVMHRGPKTFSKNGLDTIVPKFGFAYMLGQRYVLSFADRCRLFYMYQHCRRSGNVS